MFSNFKEQIEQKRKQGYSDTRILEGLSQNSPELAEKIKQSRAMYGQGGVSNDRDLVNFLSQKFSGSLPSTPSVPDTNQENMASDVGEEKKGFFGRLGDNLTNRISNIKDIAKRTSSANAGVGIGNFITNELINLTLKKDKQSVGESVLQTAGQVAGAGGDVIGQAIVSGIDKVVSDEKKMEILNNPMVQEGVKYLSQSAEMYNEWRTNNPRAAANLESVVNIADFVSVSKLTGLTYKGVLKPTLGKVGEGLEVAGEALEQSAKKSQLDEAISVTAPKIDNTKATKKLIASGKADARMKRGVLKYIPNKEDVAIAESVAGLVSKNADAFTNIRKINDSIEAEASELGDDLFNLGADGAYEKSALEAFIKQNATPRRYRAEEDIKNYDQFIKQFLDTVDEKQYTLANLWEARKQFDKDIEKAWGGNVLSNPASPQSIKNVVRDIRKIINDFVAEQAKDQSLDFASAMKSMSNKYKAIERIAEQAPRQIDQSLLKRVQKSISKIPIIGNSLVQAGAVGGGIATGMLPSGAILGLLSSPVVLGTLMTAGVVQIGGKYITPTLLKQSLANILKISGSTLSGGEKIAIRQLMRMIDPITTKDPLPKGKAVTPSAKKGLEGDEFFGAVAGVEVDEEGNVTFDPTKAVLGMAGTVGVKKVLGKGELLKEAKKYKSADEFIKKSTIVRGDKIKIDFNDLNTVGQFKAGEKEALMAFADTPGIYFTDSVKNASSYGENLTRVKINPKANIIDGENASKILSKNDVEKIVRSNPNLEISASNWSENTDEAVEMIVDSIMQEKDNGIEFLKSIWADGGFDEGDYIKAMSDFGIDGIKIYKPDKGWHHFIIYNKEALIPELELKQIWKEANK